MNCWDFKKCGRYAGGDKVQDMGVCPAYTKGAGEACWLIAGTFCGGKIQGTAAQKRASCLSCDFYRQFDIEHKLEMEDQFLYSKVD